MDPHIAFCARVRRYLGKVPSPSSKVGNFGLPCNSSHGLHVGYMVSISHKSFKVMSIILELSLLFEIDALAFI